jgi:hypothetical protein
VSVVSFNHMCGVFGGENEVGRGKFEKKQDGGVLDNI